jgi:quercetin dioxygenase-like cupin family protein
MSLGGTVLSALVWGMADQASAHGVHGAFLSHLHPSNSSSGNYLFVSETGTPNTVDFNRSPLVQQYKIDTNQPPDFSLPVENLRKLVDEISLNPQVGTYQPSGGLYREIVNYQNSNGAFDLLQFIIPPEGASAIHTHNSGAELFLVEEGQFKIFADVDGSITYCGGNSNPFVCGQDAFLAPDFAVDKSSLEVNGVVVGPGSLIYAPAGKAHTWFNSGSTVAKIVTLLTPGGVGEAFRLAGNVTIGGVAQPLGQEENGVPTNCAQTPNISACASGDALPWNGSDTGLGFYDFNRTLAEYPNFFNLANFTLPFSTPIAKDPVILTNIATPDCSNPNILLNPTQTSGPLSSGSITASSFSVAPGGSCASSVSSTHKLFHITDGEVTFDLGGIVKVAGKGTTVYVPPNLPYDILGSGNGGSILAFDVKAAVIPEPYSLLGVLGVGLYLTYGVLRRHL